MKALFDRFDLCDPTTSVSMTINGPAPTILAMFLNTAIDQQMDHFAVRHGRPRPRTSPQRSGPERSAVRGTVQADILKEDQGQNTCIFSTEFSLGVMADIQEFFTNGMGNFYSVSISGYHIAEAGANPISQLAFTLANGFTYVEAYLARGMGSMTSPPTSRSSSPTEWTPSTPCRTGGPEDLGGGPARPLRGQPPVAEAQVPHPDLGPVPPRSGDVVQRHPDHPAGPLCHL